MEPATCTCGHQRCSEAFAATRGVLRNAPRAATTIRELSALAMSGDGAAVTAFAAAGTWLGHAIAAVAGALKIETVTVGGGLAVAGRTRVSNVYVDAARTTAQELTGSPLHVLESQLGNDGGLLGAAALAAEPRQPHETPGVGQDVGLG
jgi:glucokinase